MNLNEKLVQKMATHESEHIRNLAKEFDVTELEVVENLPEHYRLRVPTADFEKIWHEVVTWDEVLFFIDKEYSIVEVSGKLPEGKMMGPMFNVGNEESALHAHIFVENLEAIYLINKPLFGKESLAISFYAKDGSSMFSLYAGRDKSRLIIESVKKQYHKLWLAINNKK